MKESEPHHTDGALYRFNENHQQQSDLHSTKITYWGTEKHSNEYRLGNYQDDKGGLNKG